MLEIQIIYGYSTYLFIYLFQYLEFVWKDTQHAMIHVACEECMQLHLWLGFPVVRVSSSLEQRKPAELWFFSQHSSVRRVSRTISYQLVVTNFLDIIYCFLTPESMAPSTPRYILHLFTHIYIPFPRHMAVRWTCTSLHASMNASEHTWVYGTSNLVLLDIYSICS